MKKIVGQAKGTVMVQVKMNDCGRATQKEYVEWKAGGGTSLYHAFITIGGLAAERINRNFSCPIRKDDTGLRNTEYDAIYHTTIRKADYKICVITSSSD